MLLSADQIGALNRDGCLCLPQLTSPEEAAQIRTSLDQLFARRAGDNEGAYGELATTNDADQQPNSPQILMVNNYAPDLRKTQCFKNALAIAKQVYGEKASFIMDLAILKRASSGKPTPWHQDLAFRDPRFDYKELSVWVALQDVDESTGCLQFLPGTQAGPVLQHRQTSRDGESIALECIDDFDPTAAVPGKLPIGGCTIHFPGTLHCSYPNSSPRARIAYIITFGLAPTMARSTSVSYPWRTSGDTAMQVKRRKWMRSGGAFVTLWRRIRRGDLRNPRSILYLAVRAVKTVTRGR